MLYPFESFFNFLILTLLYIFLISWSFTSPGLIVKAFAVPQATAKRIEFSNESRLFIEATKPAINESPHPTGLFLLIGGGVAINIWRWLETIAPREPIVIATVEIPRL